jgi:outer membrane lipoprotein-sorting protein
MEGFQMMNKWIGPAMTAVLVLVFGLSAFAQTADEILDAMQAEEDRLAEGGMINAVRVEATDANGETTTSLIYGIAKPGKTLMYFAEPELQEGNMYLFVDEEVDGEVETRFWVYLSVYAFFKELVTEEDLSAGFAGSSLSLSEVGGEDAREDYHVELLAEETLVVDEMERPVYVLEMTARDEESVDDVRVVMWVDREYYVTYKTEAYNDLGQLANCMEVLAVDEFEGRLTWSEMRVEDLLEQSYSTFTITDRRRPDGEIPDEIFLPENLETFDPADWGFEAT